MYIFIINPVAGKGKAKKIYLRLMKNEQYKKLDTVCFYTEYKGHAEEIASNIEAYYQVSQIKAMIVIGGDGTIHEVINGLKNKQIPISFIPGGSGNDFARGCSIPKDPNELMRNICSIDKTLSYWIGSYQAEKLEKRNFVNCIGFGFDAVVAKHANQSSFKRLFNMLRLGTVIYLLALIRVLISYKPLNITVKMDDVMKTYKRCFLITINNHPYFGGGMKINPEANNNEKDLSILVIDSISKWKVLALFATVFTGRHLQFKEIETFRAKNIKLYADNPIPYQVDGETGETSFCTIKKEPIPIKVKGTLVKVTENVHSESY